MKIFDESRIEEKKWYRKDLEGAVSSDGKPYSITFKKGTVNKLMIFFFGGGLSWNEETAASPITIRALATRKEAFYIKHVPTIQLKSIHVGPLSVKDTRNPFADWHTLVLPYSTGDFHLGNNEFFYPDKSGENQILYHKGAENVQKALEFLKSVVSETPDNLFITGVSAGGFGCVAHAPKIAQLYPDCKNIVVHSEGTFLKNPQWEDISKNVWKVNEDLITHLKSDDIISDLFHYASQSMPKETLFLHSNTVWDIMLVKFMNKFNNGKLELNQQALQDFHDKLTQAVRKLKTEIPNYYHFLTDYTKKRNGATAHIFSGTPKLIYSDIQDDTSISKWLLRAIDGNPLDVGVKFLDSKENV